MSLIVTTRFIAFLPDQKESRNPDSYILRIEADVRKRDFSILQTREYFFACGKVAYEFKNAYRGELMILDVFPGTKASGRNFDSLMRYTTWPKLHSVAAVEAQFYNLIKLSCSMFQLESDPLGIKPFYQAEVKGGMVLASRIDDLLAIFPDLSHPPDAIGFYGLMMMASPPTDRTLHKRIRRSKTGACYVWRVGENLVITRERRIKAPSVDPTIGIKKASKQIFEALTKSILNRTRITNNQAIYIALSGGYDSRFLVALAAHLAMPIEAFTYGLSYHREVYVARHVAKTLGVSHHVIPYPKDNLVLRLPLHLEAIEGQADLGSIQIANLLDSTEAFGTPLMIGFLGDALGGAHLDWVEEKDYRSLNNLANGIVLAWSMPEGFQDAPFSGMTFSKEACQEEVLSELCESAYPYQALMIWDFENRQRRFIGSHIQILGEKYHMIAPYYDIELIESWLSLPCIALIKRNLFFRMMERYFPEMAKIPHASNGHLIIPNLRCQLLYWGRARCHSLISKVPVFHKRNYNIENLWTSLTPKQEAYMWLRIFKLKGAMDDVFGICVSDHVKSALHGSPQLIRNLYMISEYAALVKANRTC
ncbi:MAG: hypothetical protein KAS87_02685 [Candidatus Omnitrophica bacterium]|nr:hypothetical protein [Candidatus Omnitrophota bacterium]